MYVDAGTHRRAMDYARRGAVVALRRVKSNTYEGVVRGSKQKPYRCTLKINRAPDGTPKNIAYGQCDCPVGSCCKHLVACYIVLLKQDGLGQPHTGDVKRQSLEVEPGRAGTITPDAWLQWANTTLAPNALSDSKSISGVARSKSSILYVLRVFLDDGLQQRLVLSLLRGSGRQEDGSYRRTIPLTELRPKLVSPQDEKALKTLLSGAAEPLSAWGTEDGFFGNLNEAGNWNDLDEQNHPLTLWVRGPAVAQALSEVAATGELYYGSVTGPRLRLGAPRWGKLAWSRGEDFKQRLGLILKPPAELMYMQDVPVFIDPVAGELGRIVTDVHPALLAQLAAVPAVLPEAAGHFVENMSDRLEAHMPAPEVLPVIDVDTTPTRHLELCTRTDAAGEAQVVANIQFFYGDQGVAADDQTAALYRQTETGIERIRRHTSFEKKARRALAQATKESQVDDSSGPTRVLGQYDSRQAMYDAATRMQNALAGPGWVIHIEDKLAAEMVTVDSLPGAHIQPSSQRGWFELDMGIAVSGHKISLVPILIDLLSKPDWGLGTAALRASKRPQVYVPVGDNKIVALPTGRIIEILELFESLGSLTQVDGEGRIKLPLTDAHLLMDLRRRDKLRLTSQDGMEQLAQALHDSANPSAVVLPQNLQATLRNYQHIGLSWLQMLRRHNFGGILADDMGLGKTVQTLAHLQVEKNEGRLEQGALIVCPTSVLGTWQDACLRFTPELVLGKHHGGQRQWDVACSYDLVLTTYGTLLRDVDTFAGKTWSVFILDEAQMVKNPMSKSYAAACRPNASQHLALTGTPLENNLQELWALMNWCMPGLLDTRQRFDKHIAKPIELGANPTQQATLLARLKPFLLRRRKFEVMTELPAKTEIVEQIEISGKQRDLYEVVRTSLDRKVRDAIRERGLTRSMLTILDALLKLRQICCDPRLLRSPDVPKGCQSAKMTRLFELLPDLIEAGRRVLIFSQFTSMLDLIEHELAAMEIDYFKLTGRTRKREAVVQAFRTGTAPIFLISLKAGGIGLNLPEADTVIHYDPWWNPAAEDQATARAHRMGQKKAVFVYKLVVKGSVEAKILELQAKKRVLFDALLNGGTLEGKFSADDVDGLLAPMAAPERQSANPKSGTCQ